MYQEHFAVSTLRWEIRKAIFDSTAYSDLQGLALFHLHPELPILLQAYKWLLSVYCSLYIMSEDDYLQDVAAWADL